MFVQQRIPQKNLTGPAKAGETGVDRVGFAAGVNNVDFINIHARLVGHCFNALAQGGISDRGDFIEQGRNEQRLQQDVANCKDREDQPRPNRPAARRNFEQRVKHAVAKQRGQQGNSPPQPEIALPGEKTLRGQVKLMTQYKAVKRKGQVEQPDSQRKKRNVQQNDRRLSQRKSLAGETQQPSVKRRKAGRALKVRQPATFEPPAKPQRRPAELQQH